MTDRIIAITIGPVYETIKLTSKPAGLWAGSYLFSCISEQLIFNIRKSYPETYNNIITPYFDFDEAAKKLHSSGVGYYHDHIIIRNADLDRVIEIIETVKEKIADSISEDLYDYNKEYDKDEIKQYVKKWLRIYAVEIDSTDSGNAVLDSAGYLDAIELAPELIESEKDNYMAMFLENEVLKNSFIVNELDNWQLLKPDGTIKSIEDIARNGKDNYGKKYHYYFALVSSDGDRMGKILNKLKSDDELKDFSKNCQRYITLACQKIREFGGVVIYAGGDDIQFISPLINRDKSLTELIEEIVKQFNDVFVKEKEYEGEKPSVSFGINIVYKKYPLYEALVESSGLLYEAKNNGRDAAVIRLEKHSGQTLKLCINDLVNGIALFNEKIRPLISAHTGKDMKNGVVLNSVLEHIRTFSTAFETAIPYENGIDNFIDNFFDNEGQRDGVGYLAGVKELIKYINRSNWFYEKNGDNKTNAVLGLLKYISFYGEDADREEDD